MKILIAGMGNVLHRDDGFGVQVANTMVERARPGVTVIEVGTGGIHLVQALLDKYDALIVADAVDRGADPGTIFVLEPSVPELSDYTPEERHEILVDMHYAVPSRAMVLARALDSLPSRVWIVGCQPQEVDAIGIGLTDVVAQAVPSAVEQIEALLSQLEAENLSPGDRERRPA